MSLFFEYLEFEVSRSLPSGDIKEKIGYISITLARVYSNDIIHQQQLQ